MFVFSATATFRINTNCTVREGDIFISCVTMKPDLNADVVCSTLFCNLATKKQSGAPSVMVSDIMSFRIEFSIAVTLEALVNT